MYRVIRPQLDGVRINEDRSLPTALIQAIRKAYDHLADIVNGASGGVGLGPVIDLTLRQAVTPISDPGGPSALYILRQDPTGGRNIIWAPTFTCTTASIDTTANTVSTFFYVRSAGNLVLIGQPSTGMTP